MTTTLQVVNAPLGIEKGDGGIITYLVHVFPEDIVGRGKVKVLDLLLGHHDVNPSRRRRRCRNNALTH